MNNTLIYFELFTTYTAANVGKYFKFGSVYEENFD